MTDREQIIHQARSQTEHQWDDVEGGTCCAQASAIMRVLADRILALLAELKQAEARLAAITPLIDAAKKLPYPLHSGNMAMVHDTTLKRIHDAITTYQQTQP